MHEIGAFEAKNKLSALLERMERGEEILITRRGKPVAKLVPAVTTPSRALALEAANHILERSQSVTLGGLKLKDLIAGCARPQAGSVSHCSGYEPNASAPSSPRFGSTLARRVAFQRFLDTFRFDADLDPGALLLQDHRRARVAVAPAAVQRLGELGERQIGDPHRHIEVAAELGGEAHVLVGETQRRGGGLVLAGQELIDQPIEGAASAAGAVT